MAQGSGIPGGTSPDGDTTQLNAEGLLEVVSDVRGSGWVEDPNSPFTASSAGSLTCNLANTYDEILVRVNLTDAGYIYITVNGDTTANYEYVGSDGNVSTGQSDWEATFAGGSKLSFHMLGKWVEDTAWGAQQLYPSSGGDFTSATNTVAGNSNISSPVTSFTVNPDFTTDINVRVWGVNY